MTATTHVGHPEHEGLGFSERGETHLFGRVKHWHRYVENGAERRRGVDGTVEGCNDAYAAGEQPLSDEELLAKIREADEANDPTPEFQTLDLGPGLKAHVFAPGTDVVGAERALRLLDENSAPMPHRPANAPTRYVSAKPVRGGKRSCMTIWRDDAGLAACHHSESRHNASGKCRSCECTEFMVKDES